EGVFRERIKDARVPVLLRDARRADALREAGVARARAIIPCTENDLTNLEIALNARELRPGIRVVLRMFDHDLAKKVERGFGIHIALSTSALAAPAFAAAATQARVTNAFYVGDALLHVMHLSVQPASPLVGQTVAQMEQAFDLSVILHQRGGSMDFHPLPDITLQPADHVVIFATLEVLNRFRQA